MKNPFRLLTITLGGLLASGLAAQPSRSASDPVRHPNMGVCTHLAHPNHHWDLDRLLPLISDLGVGWIRDEVSWRLVEPQKGRYEVPARLQTLVDTMQARRIKVCLILNFGNKNYDNIYDPQAYAKAAAWLAKELRGKVHAIEVLNEPANFGFSKHYGGAWNGWNKADQTVSPWVSRYVELLNATAKAVKAASPQTQVIGLGSVAPVNFRQLEMGISQEVDGMVDHPYSFRTVPENIPFSSRPVIVERDGIATADERGTFASQIEMYRAVSKKHNGPKSIWLTEWGFPTHIERDAKQYAGYTEEAQAKYALRRFAQCLGLGVEASFWYDLWEDGTDPYEAEHHFGMIARDYRVKPVYTAVKRFTRFMVPLRRAEAVEVEAAVKNTRTDQWPITWDGGRLESSGDIQRFAFTNEAGDLTVLAWSTERANGDLQPRVADIQVRARGDFAKQVVLQDLWTGVETVVDSESKDGRVIVKTLQVPPHPIALTFKSTRTSQ